MSATLCIDIGQTRIKSAVLDDDLASVDDLRGTTTHVIPSMGWLNHSFPRLLDDTFWPSLTYRREFDPHDSIAVTIPARLQNGRLMQQSHLVRWGMPEDPAAALRGALGKNAPPVRVANDAHAWLKGAIAYFQLAGKEIGYPCALVALGTGIGFAYAKDERHFRLVEFAEEEFDWEPLRKVADITAEVYELLGIRFFDSVRKDHRDWDFAHICEEFTQRFTTFLNIVLPQYPVNTLFIGGGHANYLHRTDIRLDTSVDHVLALRGRNPDIEVDADLIPLLGLLKIH